MIFAVVAVENRGAFSARPADAPASEFSAARALAAERAILGGNTPHPVGSAAHDAVRERLAAHLQSLGYEVVIQRVFACTANAVCAPVQNIIARAAGDNRPDALLLTAHYDSVPAGPGASDDGIGVATIVETARALRGVRLRNPIVLLIADAEEAGLIGAEGFAADQNQQHGDHALAMARALGNADLRQTSDSSAVWFDVLSWFVIWWPQRWSLGMAMGALVVLLVVVVLQFFDRNMPGGGATLGVIAFFASLIFAFIGGLAGSWIAGMRAHHAAFVANPGPVIAAMWLIGLAIPLSMAHRVYERAKFDGLYLGQGVSWCAIAIALGYLLPGASYLAVVPAVTAALLAVARATLGVDDAVISIVNAAVAAVILFPLAFSVYDALGAPALPVIAAVVAMVTTTFAPLIVSAPPLRRALVSAFLITAVVFIGIANLVAPYTAEEPRHINVRYYQDGQPQWLADAVTPAMARAAKFAPARRRMFEWLNPPSTPYAAPAPSLGAPAPEVQVLRDERSIGGARHLMLQVRSARGANGRVSLLFRTAKLQSIRVNGVFPPPPPQRFRNFLADDWHQATVRGAAEETVEITLAKDEPIDAVAIDTSYGLPPSGAALARARDASIAGPAHDGDTTTIVRRLRSCGVRGAV